MLARVIVAVVFVPVILIVLCFLPPAALVAAISILSMIAVFEMLKSAPNKINKNLIIFSMIFAALIPVWIYFGSKEFAAIFGLFFFVIAVFIEGIIDHKNLSFADICLVFFTAVVIPFFLSSFIRIESFENGRIYVLFPFLTAFGSDAIAFFVGIAFGKHKIAPEISPKKSLEGAIGGFAGSILFILACAVILQVFFNFRCDYPILVFYGLAGGFVSQIGDFSMSYIKRQYEIKDFGKLLPGHGGILDRFDSVLFAAPMMEILIIIMPPLVKMA